jgi:hypothetical protein
MYTHIYAYMCVCVCENVGEMKFILNECTIFTKRNSLEMYKCKSEHYIYLKM